MKLLLNWLNSYPDNAKAWVVGFVMLTICFAGLFIGLKIDHNSLSNFLARDNAGVSGQVIFALFALLWAVGLIVAFAAKRQR